MDAKGFFSNWIVRSLIWALAFVAALMIGTSIVLAIVTRHGSEVTAPDFTNLTYEDACALAAVSDVGVEIYDSVSVTGVKPGVVFSQQPREGSIVKKGRSISLTMNSKSAKKVSMPLLVGTSLRQARAELSSKGLLVGRLSYENDIATNHVLKQRLRGRDVPAGLMIPGGSRIDLVLGLSPDADPAYIPSVTGMKKQRAIDVLQDNSLNISKVVYDSSVRTYGDSSRAVVYKQNPASGLPVSLGSSVAIYLTVDEDKLKTE